MAINPTGAELKQLLADDSGGPVVMLNLLRFNEGGQVKYGEYSRSVLPFLERYGAEVVYFGTGSTALVAESGQDWDAVILVRYPSREAFTRMVSDPEYQAITHLRSESLTEAVLQATIPLH